MASPAMPPAPPTPPNPVQIPGATQAGYDQQTAAANRAYQASLSQNTLQSQQSQQRYAQMLQGFNFKENLLRNQLPYQYNGNGMYGSGVWRQALQNYAQNRLMQTQALNMRNSQAGAMFDVQRQQLAAQHAEALAQIQGLRGQLIAQLAAQNIPQVAAP